MIHADFHIHSNNDPHDRYIRYSPHQLIDRLAEKGITLASITHHEKLVFEEAWKAYAEQKGICLLPGVELNIDGADVLLINATTDNIDTFNQLREYKRQHQDCLIIAPHPFGAFVSALNEKLEEHIDVFDAIEINAAMVFATKSNWKAVQMAHKHNKPLLAGSDTHHLMQVGTARNTIDATTWEEALTCIKQGRIRPKITVNPLRKYGILYPRWFYEDHIRMRWLKVV